MKRLLLLPVFFVLAMAAAAAAAVFAPSGIMAHPNSFDRKNVTALGHAENVVVRPAGAGTMFTQFQLCDSICVNVISNGPPKVVNGQNVTVNGTFYVFLVRGPVQAHDIIVTGP
jgi:opacity protein-like surface antigen